MCCSVKPSNRNNEHTSSISNYISISLHWHDECKHTAYMRQHTAQYFGAVLVVFWNLHEWSFSVIVVTYRYGSEVSLNNTYIHLHALSRLLGTNCTRKRRFGDSGSTSISVNEVALPRAL